VSKREQTLVTESATASLVPEVIVSVVLSTPYPTSVTSAPASSESATAVRMGTGAIPGELASVSTPRSIPPGIPSDSPSYVGYAVAEVTAIVCVGFETSSPTST
jgi:hypothetical protein